jgi:hypothetical protein
MNVFYLDADPRKAARMHCDKHCCKMIIEYAQLLSTAHRVLDGKEYYDRTANNRRIKRWLHPETVMERNLYKASHINHPSNIWLRQSVQNYNWLFQCWIELCKEYEMRYGRVHMTYSKLKTLVGFLPKNLKPTGFTPPTPAMPDYCKIGSSLESYRFYYIQEKKRFAKWTNRKTPEWFHQKIL